eukprot:TRINITY_DN28206_c0_g1_i1.p1 TRINITY_DN28206_c0_g1~~TRINITY_DN28206_c0_g1_i1.p1  ORF type:complete len:684 (+),score=143.62 TRINITY_DN28206_c0_g1_i1:39-2054(+)
MPPRNWRDSIPRPPPLLHPNAGKIATPASEVAPVEQSPPLLGQLISGADISRKSTPVLYPSAGTSNPPGNQSVSVIASGIGGNNLEATIASLSATLQQTPAAQSPYSNQQSPQSMLSAPNQALGLSTTSLQKSPIISQHLSAPSNHLGLGASVSSIQTPSAQNHLTVRSSKLGASTSSLSPAIQSPNSLEVRNNPVPQSHLSAREGNLGMSTTMSDTVRTLGQQQQQQLVSPRQNMDATTREELLAQTIGSLNQALGMSVGPGGGGGTLEGTATQLNASQLSPHEDLQATIASLQKGIIGNTVPSVSSDAGELPPQPGTGVPYLTVSGASNSQVHDSGRPTPTQSGQHLSAFQDSLASVLRVATEDIIDNNSLNGDFGLPPTATQTPVQNNVVTQPKKKRKKKTKKGFKPVGNQPSVMSTPGETPIRTPPSEVLPASSASNLQPMLVDQNAQIAKERQTDDSELLKSLGGVRLSKYGDVGDPEFKKMMAEAVRSAEAAKKIPSATLAGGYQNSIETSSTSVPPPFALPEDEDDEALPMQFTANIQTEVPKEVMNKQLQVCTFPGHGLPNFPFVNQHPSIPSRKSIRTPVSCPPSVQITTPPSMQTSSDMLVAVSRALGGGQSPVAHSSIGVDDGLPDVVTLAKRLAYDLRCRPASPPPISADLIDFASRRL